MALTGDVTDTYYAGDCSIGYGAQWMIGQTVPAPTDPTTDTFVAVAQVSSINFGNMTANVINKTHLRSPGRAHEKCVTIRDFDAFSMTGVLNLTHGSHNNAGGDGFTTGGMIAIHRNLEERNMQIVLNDGSPATVVPFKGVISSLSLGELTLEGLQSFTASVQPLSDYTAGLP